MTATIATTTSDITINNVLFTGLVVGSVICISSLTPIRGQGLAAKC